MPDLLKPSSTVNKETHGFKSHHQLFALFTQNLKIKP